MSSLLPILTKTLRRVGVEKKRRREPQNTSKTSKRADIVYIVDKDGYVGRSTSVEIGVAYGLGKEIYALEQIKDPAVDILINEVLSPEELITRIKEKTRS